LHNGKKEITSVESYMEENLEAPLGKIIQIIGDSILRQTRYFGAWTMKIPLNSWVYQEIICKTKPDVKKEIYHAK
jgi:hypothetical protein